MSRACAKPNFWFVSAFLRSIHNIATTDRITYKEFGVLTEKLNIETATELLEASEKHPVTHIDLSDMDLHITPQCAMKIVAFSSLKELILAHTQISTDSLKYLAENCKTIRKLIHLDLEYARFEEEELLWYLLIHIGIYCPDLQHLNIANTCTTIGVPAMLSLACFKNLKTFKGENCVISPDANIIIGEVFKNLERLEKLDLSCCNLTPDGATNLGESLAKNCPFVNHLKLAYNQIGKGLWQLQVTFVRYKPPGL